MKKLVRVSLFVLMALTLSLAIGCKHDSDPEPAPADVAGKNDPAPEQKPASSNFEGTWVNESGNITCTINADGTFVTQADKKYEGQYHVSPDGKTVTATVTVEGKEETFTLTSKSEDTLELTLPESFGGEKVTLTKKVNADSDPEQKPAPSNFVGEWKSTDGSTTVTVTSDGEFTTEVTGMPQPFSGTYTVSSDGKTLTTSEITLPGDTSGTKVAFSMKLKDSENDVMDLPLSEIGMEKVLVLVKESTDNFNLDGTWKGKVVAADNADATIVFADNEANLTLAGQTVTSTNVSQNGNSFTITWEDNPLNLRESTGLISGSGKAWLDDGSVFTK